MISKEYDAALISWGANYQDPMSFLDRFLSVSTKNYPGWTSPEYNALLLKANASLDVKKRAEFLAQAERLIGLEVPFAPLFHWGYPIVIHPHVQGLYISPAASVDFTQLKVVPHAKHEHRKIVHINHRTKTGSV